MGIVDELAKTPDERRAEPGILRRVGSGKLGGLVPQEVEVEIGGLSGGWLVHGEAAKSSTWGSYGSLASKALRR
jgi:hypothetical protein